MTDRLFQGVRKLASNRASFSNISLVDYLSSSNEPAIAFKLSQDYNTNTWDAHLAVEFRNKCLHDHHIERLARSDVGDKVHLEKSTNVTTSDGANWAATYFNNFVVLVQQACQHQSCFTENETGIILNDEGFYSKTVPCVEMQKQIEFIDLFMNKTDWSKTSVGPIQTWGPLLKGLVNITLASPNPTLISWGKEMTLIYNASYIDNIGQKHPKILGMGYAEAWPEVWPMIEPFVLKAYSGEGTHVTNTQMFLQRFNILEECFFTWSMVPIRNHREQVVGVFIPNFDGTQSVISERRMRTLQSLGQHISALKDYAEFYDRARLAFMTNPIDLPLVAIYSTGTKQHNNADLENQSMPNGHESDYLQSGSNRQGSNKPLTLSRKVLLGCDEDFPAFPSTLSFTDASESEPLQDSFISHILAGYRDNDVVKVPARVVQEELVGLKDSTWGDAITNVVIFSICPLDKEHPEAVAIIGTNTRRHFDDDMRQFLELLRRQLVAGMAGVLLYTEELRRTKALAALNLKKKEELKDLLEARTKELRETEGKYSRMAEITRSGLAIGDCKTMTITYANDAWYDVSGHPRTESANTFMDSVHPDDKEAAKAMYAQSMLEPIRFDFRWKNPTTEGYTRWVSCLSSPERNSEGEITSVVYAVNDISGQKRVEEILRKEASDAIERKRQQEYFIDMTSHELRNPLSAIIHSLELISSVTIGIQEDLRGLKDTASNPKDVDKMLEDSEEIQETVKIVGLCSSHMKRLIDDTLTLSKLESDLVVLNPAPFAPHELCSTVMKMFDAELLAKDITSTLVLGAHFNESGGKLLIADSSRLTQVFINLLTNAIKFTAQGATRKITVTLDCTTEPPVLPKFDFREIPFEIATADSSSPAMIPADYQADIASPQSLYESNIAPLDRRYLLISVADSGVGMSKAELGLLFHRFSQVKPRTHTTYGGSGLGLYISKMLTSKLGGEITVQSTEGEGSVFSFYVEAQAVKEANKTDIASDFMPAYGLPMDIKADIPKITTMTEQKHVSKPSSTITSKKTAATSIKVVQLNNVQNKPKYRLLLVEDNLINQKLMCKQLTKAGCHIATADNGKEAVDYILQTTFAHPDSQVELDLCLMDVEMPIMDGLTACKTIRELQTTGHLLRHVPIIAVTANAREEQIKAIIATGMDHAVSKPFKWPILMEEIQRILDETAKKYPSQLNNNITSGG